MTSFLTRLVVLPLAIGMAGCNGDEDPHQGVYLAAVYSLPADDQAPDAFVNFELEATGGAAATLLPARSGLRPALSDAWRARLGFEAYRRQRLLHFIDDLRAGRESLPSRGQKRGGGCVADCGASAMCWDGGCAASAIDVVFGDGTAITCDLQAVVSAGSTSVNVLVDASAAAGAGALAQTVVERFADTLARELSIMGQSGHTGSLDRDNDGRLTVVFTDYESAEVDSSVAGLFWFPDFLPTGTSEATGNEADILWVRVPVAGEEAVATGTLAHEYLHLVSYAQRVHARSNDALRETLWLDEGLAHLMEDLTGWGPSNVEVVEFALQNWLDSGFATEASSAEQELVTRGQAYLLLRHMIDREGGEDAASDDTLDAATSLVSGLIAGEALGFQHTAFQNADPDFIWHWLVGVYSTGQSDVVADAHAYDYLPVGTDSVTGEKIGMNTHGQFETARGDVINLGADGLAPETKLPSEESLYISGSILYELAADPGQLSVTDDEDDVDVRAKTLLVK